ncbi:MAG TPA: hypothetical protein VIK48_03925, partial [Candidatus Manganitrophaceae bacterium]
MKKSQDQDGTQGGTLHVRHVNDLGKKKKRWRGAFLFSVVIPVFAVTGYLLLVGLPKISLVSQPLERELRRRTVREPLQASKIVVNPQNTQVVYASSHFYGMWKSVDGGAEWRHSMKGLGTSDVYSMAIHPQNPDILFAATTGGGIFRSMDAGETWIEESNGLTDSHVEEIAFDPAEPNTLYAVTLREVFKSSDGGLTWKRAFEENRWVMERTYMKNLSVARAPGAADPIIFVGTPAGGFRRGEKEGDWEPLEKKLQGAKASSFAYDPRDKTVYAGTMARKGFYRSLDGGKAWELLGTPPALFV